VFKERLEVIVNIIFYLFLLIPSINNICLKVVIRLDRDIMNILGYNTPPHHKTLSPSHHVTSAYATTSQLDDSLLSDFMRLDSPSKSSDSTHLLFDTDSKP